MGTGTTSDADWACQGDDTNVQFFQIVEGSYRLGYIQRGFKQRDSMGTGTTSDADWACQGDDKNVHFFQDSRGVATGLGTGRNVRFPLSSATTC